MPYCIGFAAKYRPGAATDQRATATAAEALLLAAAAQANARKADSFAVIEEGGNYYAGREGLTTMGASVVVVFPDDPMWASQTARSLGVGTVNDALKTFYPAPPAR